MKHSVLSLTIVIAAGWVAASAMAGPAMVGGGAETRIGECMCGERLNGDPFCFLNELCDDVDPCDPEACPDGYTELRDNCCEEPKRQCVCARECPGTCDNPGTYSGGDCDPGFPLCEFQIPAASEWGLLVMALLGLAAGTIMFRRARAVAA